MRAGIKMVGAKGFEPSTSWSRTRRASQAALRPESYSYFPTVYAGLRASATIRLEAKTKPSGSFCSPAAFEGCYLDSEFVAQCELHHARLGREPGEIPERRAKHVQRAIDAQWIKPFGIRYVVNAPTQLNAVSLGPWHFPAFCKIHVHREKARTAQIVALPRFSRKWLAEGTGCRCQV